MQRNRSSPVRPAAGGGRQSVTLSQRIPNQISEIAATDQMKNGVLVPETASAGRPGSPQGGTR